MEEYRDSESDSKTTKKIQKSFFEVILNYKNKINIDYTEIDFQKGENSPRLLLRKRKIIDKIDNNEINQIQISKDNFINISANIGSNNYNINQAPTNISNISLNNKPSYLNNNSFPSNTFNIQEDKSKNYIYQYIALVGNKIKSTFENYLDFVHESYFNNETTTNNHYSNTNISNSSSINGNLQNEDNIQIDEKKNINNSKNGFRFSSLDLLVNPLRQKFIWETWSPYEISLFECCVCKFHKNFDFYAKIVKK
jgi:hypothetical protein